MDLKSSVTKRKGRGFAPSSSATERDEGLAAVKEFEHLESDASADRACKSVEGWAVFVTGIHEEATEEDVHDRQHHTSDVRFADFGKVKNIAINLDHRTGYVKGYALVEYDSLKEAKAAIDSLDGTKLLDQVIHCDYAFVKSDRRK